MHSLNPNIQIINDDVKQHWTQAGQPLESAIDIFYVENVQIYA